MIQYNISQKVHLTTLINISNHQLHSSNTSTPNNNYHTFSRLLFYYYNLTINTSNAYSLSPQAFTTIQLSHQLHQPFRITTVLINFTSSIKLKQIESQSFNTRGKYSTTQTIKLLAMTQNTSLNLLYIQSQYYSNYHHQNQKLFTKENAHNRIQSKYPPYKKVPQDQQFKVLIVSKDYIIEQLKSTLEIQQLKVGKMDQLLRIKDSKIQSLISKLQQAETK